jgi:type IV fimbrial biogenesis protein FimT
MVKRPPITIEAMNSPLRPTKTNQLAASGFTLVETMVVVAIISILTAFAAPSMTRTLERYRMTAYYDELRSTYMFARSEAIRTRQQVVVARVPSAAGCTSGSTQEWQCGWVVFVDANSDFVQQPTEATIKSVAPAPGTVQVTHNAGNPGRIGFDRWGNGTAAGGMGNYVFLPNNDPSTNTSSPNAFRVCVSSGGRIRRLSDASVCP